MARKLASIDVVKEIIPIEGYDRIELAVIDGWRVIVRKGLYEVGAKLVYFEIDSVLPDDDRWNRDLDRYKFRVRTIKMAGVYSQGYTMPISELLPSEIRKAGGIEAGTDYTEALKVTKYEPDEFNQDVSMGKKKKVSHINPYFRQFPSFIPKTDETRIQRLGKQFDDLHGTVIYITEKLDGSSMTVYIKDDHFAVCSRNIEFATERPKLPWWKRALVKVGVLKDPYVNAENPKDNHFCKLVARDELEQKMRNAKQKLGCDFAIQGEIIGPSIQNNRYNLRRHEYYLFGAYNITAQRYFSYGELKTLVAMLNVKMVPELGVTQLTDTAQELIDFSIAKSVLDKSVEREGVVIRTTELHGRQPISFKVISPKYLLKAA